MGGTANRAGQSIAALLYAMAMERRKLALWAIRTLLVATLIFILHLATTDRPYDVVAATNDKLGHFLAFGAVAGLVDFAFPASGFGWRKALFVFAFGAIIEIVQAFLPHRESAVIDLAADALGIAAYAVVIAATARLPAFGWVAAIRRGLATAPDRH
jgi:VanZ family protein